MRLLRNALIAGLGAMLVVGGIGDSGHAQDAAALSGLLRAR